MPEFRISNNRGRSFRRSGEGAAPEISRRRMAECFHLSVGLRLIHVLGRRKHVRSRPAERFACTSAFAGTDNKNSKEAPAASGAIRAFRVSFNGLPPHACRFRRKNGFQNLPCKLVGRGFDLMPGSGGFCFDRLRAAATRSRAASRALARAAFPLGIPLLHPLLAAMEYLRAGGAQFRLVLLGSWHRLQQSRHEPSRPRPGSARAVRPAYASAGRTAQNDRQSPVAQIR